MPTESRPRTLGEPRIILTQGVAYYPRVAALDPVSLTGLFALGGVALGALLTPLHQLMLERMRERRASDRARQLIAGEMLHGQFILLAASELSNWPAVESIDAHLPISMWREHRSSLAGYVDGDLWEELVRTYAFLELDRERFITANRIPGGKPLSKDEAKSLRDGSMRLGRVRRKLLPGGGFLAEFDEVTQSKARDPRGED